MVQLARRRLAGESARVRLWIGDACEIPSADGVYDAVFDFGVLHHVSSWREAIAETHRVLKPGGRFYAEEVLAGFIRNPIARRLFDHPLHDRFDAAGFRAAVENAGFRIVGVRTFGQMFVWVVADKEDGAMHRERWPGRHDALTVCL